MSYLRKTADEYQLHVDYGYGFEYVLAEDTMSEARQRRKEYRENCPQYPTKIVKKRVPIKKEETE